MSVALQLPVGAGTITPAGAEPDIPARIVWPFGADAENVRRLRAGWRLAALKIAQATTIAIDPEGLTQARAWTTMRSTISSPGSTPPSTTGSAPAVWERSTTPTAWSTRNAAVRCRRVAHHRHFDHPDGPPFEHQPGRHRPGRAGRRDDPDVELPSLK